MADCTPPAAAPAAALRQRTEALARLFTGVAQTRMAGVPILNPALRVEAVGFELEEPAAVGILITPWFMNLLWFPLARSELADGVGRRRVRRVGTERFDFIGGFEPGFGAYEACSLFSPMFEFADPAAARATALAVLSALRPPVVTAPPLTPVAAPPLAARRAFLFGRRAVAQGAP